MIAILQPFIPHYREDFFVGIDRSISCDVFCYNDDELIKNKFETSKFKGLPISSLEIKGILIYNPFAVLTKKYETLVLMLHPGHITTWLLLFTKIFHKKKIILWGHGISVKRYCYEEENPSLILKWMISLSDSIWLYTNREKEIWKKVLPNKKIVALNNTISDVGDIIYNTEVLHKELLKQKYKLKETSILIFCARFNTLDRRTDLLIELIEKLETENFGFIIIGDGNLKPDFTKFKNVYDFGAVYNRQTKTELFAIADIYFQPAWVGLSIVEAMAYSKPIFTLKRTTKILQCVEYSYLQNGENSMIFSDIDNVVKYLNQQGLSEIHSLSYGAQKYVIDNLLIERMIQNALMSLN